MNKTNAIKKDYDKPPMQLLPTAALVEISKVLEFGAKKYSAENWRNGLEWSRLFGAALRHIFAHKDGEDLDSETGLSHLAHAGCCILFLLEHEMKNLGKDDRWKYDSVDDNEDEVKGYVEGAKFPQCVKCKEGCETNPYYRINEGYCCSRCYKLLILQKKKLAGEIDDRNASY